MRSLTLVVAICAALAVVALSVPARSVAADCTFELGFKTLRDMIPDRVGDCRENARSTENGDVQQLTTGGLLAWRKADNWTAFTNGSRTWINGPCGLQERPSDLAFLWEVSNYTSCTEPGLVTPIDDVQRPTPTATPYTIYVPPTPTTIPPTPMPPPTTAPVQPIERRGSTSQNTTAFHLGGGAYTVAWSVDMPENDNCIIHLTPTTGGFGESVLNEIFTGHHSGENRVYGVAPGDYYFDVTGCGSWVISIRPYTP